MARLGDALGPVAGRSGAMTDFANSLNRRESTEPGRGVGWLAAGVLLLAPAHALAETGDAMMLHDSDGLAVRGHFQFGVNAVAEQNVFWNYSHIVAPQADFNTDTRWLEAYLKPGVSFTKDLGGDVSAYGKISGVASATVGADAFATGDTGRVTLEEGYVGLRGAGENGLSFDVSIGPREFVAGTGMLIANGGANGFKRGALKLGPRKAWEFAGLARVGYRSFVATAFYVDANEAPDSDSHNKIAGVDFRHDGGPAVYAGMTLGQVVESDAPYPKAAPNGIGVPSILPGAREGLKFLTVYGRTQPFGGALEQLFVAGDVAVERNSDISLKAWAARGQIGYIFASHPWRPTIGYIYQTFSGDDPSTPALERFDPLYYEGSPSSWSTGSKSSMVFINSNVNAHQLWARVTPSERDTITLRLARVSANELLSPIQFGQATRLEEIDGVLNPIAGVTRHHLSDDIFIEYNRTLTRNVYLTGGFSVSFPGAGADSIIHADAPNWTGGFVNVVVNF